METTKNREKLPVVFILTKHNTAGCTTDDDCPVHKPNCDTTDGKCKPCLEGKCIHFKIDGASALKLIPGCIYLLPGRNNIKSNF